MSTSPPSSGSSSDNSPSPSISLHDLKTDPSDALDFILQSMTDSNTDSSQDNSPPDWSQLSSWAQTDTKFDLTSDFNFSLPMDMDLDFDPNMAVDPSALHFTSIFDQSALSMAPIDNNPYLMSSEMASNPLLYPMPDESTWNSHVQLGTGRRLSVTSSSSSSGASLSPVIESTSVVSSSPPSDLCLSDPASELAQRVRQMAGVTLAVPVSAQVQQLAAAGGQSKLPIPRLARPNPSPAAKRPSPKPDPESSSCTPASEKADSPAVEAPPASSTTVIGRPKTSHTTIERRYRTNLNARITGLKQSVPALRVLEIKSGIPSPYNDVVDVRGFVDGVKVARKMSKANILGKATEYIRVLKKRESRLKREQDGLKSLVSGLVGGPALLKEWEREWKERFGGEEKDEVEDDDAAGSDDEDDGEDTDGEDEEGRARKKAKVAKVQKKEKPYKPAPQPVPMVPGQMPEKRKRGRPRKVPLPSVPAPVSSAEVSPIITPIPSNIPPTYSVDHPMQEAFVPIKAEHVMQQAPAQQYLLAAFAFFSVFNSPLTSSTRSHSQQAHAHQGIVLTPHTNAYPPVPPAPSAFGLDGYGLHEVVQAAHLLVSTLVFFYVLVPWITGALRQTSVLARVSSFFSRTHVQSKSSSAANMKSPYTIGRKAYDRAALTDALVPACRGSADEAARLRAALGVSAGVVGLMQGVIKAVRIDRGIELNQLEQRAWVRLGELVAFDGTVGNITRLQTYWCMSWHISTFAATTTDLSTLALIIRPVSNAKAAALWDQARKREFLRAHEKIVLNNMSVDDAAEWLTKWRRWHETERKGRCSACEKRTPLGVLAAILIRERLRKHAASLFVRTVVSEESCASECESDGYVYDAEKDFKEEQERKETVEAGKSIGGRTAELAILLERIWDTGFCTHEDVLPVRRTGNGRSPDVDADCEDAQDLASQDEAEIRALLSATIIYRRIFPSSIPACATALPFILSPPPSPSRRNAALHMALRTALGSPAFEFSSDGRLDDEELGLALEDARDRVVDMLVDFERACRRGGRF